MILLTEFFGVSVCGYQVWPWKAFEFLTQNYWLLGFLDFWFLGNNLRGEVLNFHW